jgi:1-hydroxycarotenoid 3,4-desaturase
MPQPVIVIGAGMGGLSCAAALAAAGIEVTVIEAQPEAGGKIRQVHGIDVGPTVFTMRWVFEALFHSLGTELANEVTLSHLDILARHWWPDATTFDLHREGAANVDAIGHFAGVREAEGYRRFAADSARIHDTLKDTFMLAQRGSLFSLMGKAGLAPLMGIKPFATLWDVLYDYFNDPRLRQLFARYATYVGSSPLKAPATLMLIAHVEQQGVWKLEGGMQSLVRALQKSLLAKGAQFRFSESVSRIGIIGGRVQHVDLASGERLPATHVVFNGDISALPLGLLGDQAARAVDQISEKERSLSAVTWQGLRSGLDFPLHHHNVFFSDNYEREFDDIFLRRETPSRPTTYICAAAGNDRFLALINAPPAQVDVLKATTAMQQSLQSCGLALKIAPEDISAPPDFAARFPGSGGALYGRASHGWMASFQRAGASTAIKGLYLTGGGVHPGPGLPMAAISGQLAAQALCTDQGLTLRFP